MPFRSGNPLVDMLKYPVDRYDENLLLKVPALLWLAILYGIRHAFFVAAAALMPMDVVTLPWLQMQTSPYFLLTDLPAALVLLAAGHRVPTGLNIMRRVWKAGRWLLLVSYLSGIALFVRLNWDEVADPSSWHFADGVIVLLIDLALVVYVFSSALVRDVFRDVQAAPEPAGKERARDS